MAGKMEYKAGTGDLWCQLCPAIIEFCNTLQSDGNILKLGGVLYIVGSI